jgi:hypothetical protein
MAYAEGTCTDQFDLLGKIKNFFSDNGWTVNSYTADIQTYSPSYVEGSPNAKRLHVTNGTQYLNFRSTSGAMPIQAVGYRHYGIDFNMGSGYSSALAWDEQAGVPTYRPNGYALASHLYLNGAASYRMWLLDSPFTFFLYIKYSTTSFGQLYFGTISTKYGSWDGGDLFLSSCGVNASAAASPESFLGRPFTIYAGNYSYPSSTGGYFRGALHLTTPGAVSSGNLWPTHLVVSDTATNNDPYFIPFVGWPQSFGYASDKNQYTLLSDMNSCLLQALPAAFTSPIILLPIQPALWRDSSLSRFSFLGELSHMKITAGPTSLAEQIVTYADTKYILLPMGTPTTNTYGNYINPLLAVEYEGA